MSLVVRERLLPARVTGNPVRWARDFAIGGALVPLSLSLPPFSAGGPGLALVVACAAVFGLVGAVSPMLLDGVRRSAPLWLLTILATTAGAASMQIAWWLAFGLGSGNLPLMILGGFLGLVLWLPYTVCVVTGRRTWPLVVAPGLLVLGLQLVNTVLFLLLA